MAGVIPDRKEAASSFSPKGFGMKAIRIACAAVLFLAVCSATGRADPITQIVSFGDSLSDVGNTYAQYGYPASPPYAAGRYSNGPIWLDHLASKLGVAAPTASLNGGSDYAWGGAATDTPAGFLVAGYAPLISPTNPLIGPVPNVNTQIAAYLVKNSPSSHTLYTLWAGANDFFDGQTNPVKPADNLMADIQSLISKGAKNFLVANLPSLGETPLGRGEVATARTGLDTLTVYFNAELNYDLNAIQAAHPEVQIHRLDVFSLFQNVEANASAFGLTDVTDPAILAPAGTNVDKFLFWDAVHPTAAAGVIVGDAAYQATAAPEPSSVVLVLTGCAGLLGSGRLLRRVGRPRALAALGGLLAVFLIGASASCRARLPRRRPGRPATSPKGWTRFRRRLPRPWSRRPNRSSGISSSTPPRWRGRAGTGPTGWESTTWRGTPPWPYRWAGNWPPCC